MLNPDLQQQIIARIKLRMNLKPSSLAAYSRGIEKFCAEYSINPFDFETMKLEDIEDMTERFIMTNKDTLAPKYLNVIFNSIKTWCYVLRLIKNRKMFREIKFDKSSRKMDAVLEMALEVSHIKAAFQISDIHEEILLHLYAINGLRPSLIPQLKVSDIYPKHYKIENGKFSFTVKNPFVYVQRHYEGNKAHITFFIILHSHAAELIQRSLNMLNEVNKKTTLTQRYKRENNIYDKIKEIYRKIGYEGRPYMLRSFANNAMSRTLASGKQKDDLKEYLMGHKGAISSIYQFKALTTDDMKEYLRRYQSYENYINEHVLGKVSSEQLSKAEQIKRFAQSIGVTEEEGSEIFKNFAKGKMSFEEYEKQLLKLTEKAQDRKMHENFNKLFDERMHQQ
jgi:hypothetical protein